MYDIIFNMFKISTIDRLSCYILLLNVCCINRSFWLKKTKLKILGHLIFTTSATVVIVSIIFDVLYYEHVNGTNDESPGVLQGVILVEMVLLGLGAISFRNCLETMKTVDDNCRMRDTVFKHQAAKTLFEEKPFKFTLLIVASMVFDITALKLLNFSLPTIITLSVGFAAHNAEMIFCALLINELNSRLEKLVNIDAVVGTKIYRHVLVGTSRFKEDYNISVAVMIFVTLLISIFCAVAVLLSYDMDKYLLVYIIWCDLKYLYTLWLLCDASYNTKRHCLNMIRSLTVKLVFDFNDKHKNSTYKLTKRWLACSKSFPLTYSDDKKYPVDFKLPLFILNVTFNNLLVIAQIHKAIVKQNGG